jgi:serine/threonine-protein phosphatase PP1 catalytic subunit
MVDKDSTHTTKDKHTDDNKSHDEKSKKDKNKNFKIPPPEKENMTKEEAEIFDTLNSILFKLLPKSSSSREYANLKESEIKLICNLAIEAFKRENCLVEVTSPLYVCGDIHGQYYDLLRIFNCCGQPNTASYLFLGDYVDRGKQSLETICLLLIYKIKYPNKIVLLRGNHESASINKIYGFYDECKNRVTLKSWKMFCDVFTFMPLAALIEGKILCMHGGLGPDLEKIHQIAKIKKPCEIPDEGIVCDLLWADPGEENTKDYAFNERGISVTFSSEVCKNFLESNDLDLIVRGHQVVEEGYEFFADQSLVTVFSAPNYTGEFDNNGAVMYADEDLMCSFQILKPATTKNKKIKHKGKIEKEKYSPGSHK